MNGEGGLGRICLPNVFKRAWLILMLLGELAPYDGKIYGSMMVTKFLGQ